MGIFVLPTGGKFTPPRPGYPRRWGAVGGASGYWRRELGYICATLFEYPSPNSFSFLCFVNAPFL